MKQEKIKSPSKALQREEDRWIDIKNDELMISLGIRPPHVKPKDKDVWTKTPYEKNAVKMKKRGNKNTDHFYNVPVKHIPVRTKLIIQLKKNKVFDKSTYVTECWQHEIGDILYKYYVENKTGGKDCLIKKYIYNGKEYKPDEKPFWGLYI